MAENILYTLYELHTQTTVNMQNLMTEITCIFI